MGTAGRFPDVGEAARFSCGKVDEINCQKGVLMLSLAINRFGGFPGERR